MKKTIFFVLTITLFLLNNVSAQQSPLIKAIKKGDAVKAGTLIEKGLHLNVADKDGRAPLHWVVVKAQLAENMSKNEALYGKQKYTGETWQKLAKNLIEKGARIEKTDNKGVTPLMYALVGDQPLIAAYLLDAGAVLPDDPSFFLVANAIGCEPAVAKYLESGMNPDTKNASGFTALHYAAMFNYKGICRLLLEKNAQTEAKTAENLGYYSGLTPLHFAAVNGSADVARMLLERGASVNILSPDGKTPLHYAVCGPRMEEYSFAAGKNPEEKFVSGGNLATVQELLAYGADVNVKDEAGATPLNWATYYRQLAVADALLAKGARPVSIETSADHAFASGLAHLWYGIKADSTDSAGSFYHTAHGHFDTAEKMFQKQIDKLNGKMVGRFLLTATVAVAAGVAANYQAGVMAQTSGTGFGYATVNYPVFSSGDLKTQKKYCKAQKKMCVELGRFCDNAAVRKSREEAAPEVVSMLNLKKKMEKEN